MWRERETPPGDSEELSGTSHSYCATYLAILSIGEDSTLSATCPIVCDVVGDMDKPIVLEATNNITTYVSVDTLYFGELTDLSSTSNIVSNAVNL